MLFDAASRGRYSTDASIYQITADRRGRAEARGRHRSCDGHRTRNRRARTAARRRHLAVRTDCGQGTGRRCQQAPQRNRGARRRRTSCASSTGHRARPAQCTTQEQRPVLPGRRLARQPRHHRRHDRQQLLRLALHCATATWCTTCTPSTRCWPTARARTSRMCPATWRAGEQTAAPATSISFSACARSASGRPTRSTALPQAAAPGRRLQHRLDRRHRPQHGAHAGRLGRHARLLHRDRAGPCAVPAHRVLGVCHFPTFYESMAATRHIVELGPTRGRARGPHADGVGARHRHVQADAGAIRSGQAGRAAAGRVRGRGPRRASSQAARPATLMGDLGFADGRGARCRTPRARARSGTCARPGSTS